MAGEFEQFVEAMLGLDTFCQFFLCYKLFGFQLGKAFLIGRDDGWHACLNDPVRQTIDLLFDLGDVTFQ
ncbi:MAG: hypothetical protein QNJ16_09395 [Rhodobacter sp.]|nr:hypothetical protein [Rhodobacter sp.]